MCVWGGGTGGGTYPQQNSISVSETAGGVSTLEEPLWFPVEDQTQEPHSQEDEDPGDDASCLVDMVTVDLLQYQGQGCFADLSQFDPVITLYCLFETALWSDHETEILLYVKGIHIDTKAKAISLPNRFLGNPIRCSHLATTGVTENFRFYTEWKRK